MSPQTAETHPAAHDTHDNNDNDNDNINAMTTHSEKPTPLPKFQIFLVFLIQFAEPLTASVVYPFINQFVRETGVTNGDERKTGHYAGIIVCLISFPLSWVALFIDFFWCVYIGLCIFLLRGSYCDSMGLFIRPVRTQTCFTFSSTWIGGFNAYLRCFNYIYSPCSFEMFSGYFQRQRRCVNLHNFVSFLSYRSHTC